MEERWAELPEARSGPVDMSLALLDALHQRWVAFLRTLPDAHFARTFNHPDVGHVTIDGAIALYEWHSRHHGAHIENGIRSRRERLARGRVGRACAAHRATRCRHEPRSLLLDGDEAIVGLMAMDLADDCRVPYFRRSVLRHLDCRNRSDRCCLSPGRRID
jgi:hypothetical protein